MQQQMPFGLIVFISVLAHPRPSPNAFLVTVPTRFLATSHNFRPLLTVSLAQVAASVIIPKISGNEETLRRFTDSGQILGFIRVHQIQMSLQCVSGFIVSH